jgi:hypothetical protein
MNPKYHKEVLSRFGGYKDLNKLLDEKIIIFKDLQNINNLQNN